MTIDRAPLHVGIIMDGNGRWARRRGLERTAGHKRGAEAVKRTVEAASDLGIRYLTLFGFSSENWSRPLEEVRDLMMLLRFYLKSQVAELLRANVRLSVIGDRSRLDPDIVALIEGAERRSADNGGVCLTIALSYGARAEIVQAARRAARDALDGKLSVEALDEDRFADYLFTVGVPDPDLIIRTSGEKRLSNFLMWQAAYAELVFVDTLWPDFGREALEAAVTEFQQRDRRYGAATA